ncbi:MAG: hypothetical protein WAM54_04605 [Nitrososphaeraceae archaeon]
MILSISPLAFGQNESFAPFSSLDNSLTSNSDMETSPVLSNNQKPSQEEHTNFHPLFQAIDLNSSAPTSTSSAPTSTFIVGEQNETQRQTALSSSSPRHPREPLTQYQTIIRPQVTLPPATLPGTLPPAVNFPSTTGIGGNTIYPQTTLAGSGTLPQSAVTFPPSVFPPTTSFIPPTSIAPVVGPLSPWFPSIPAIACGGTFTFSVVGSLDRNNDNGNNHDNDNKKDKNNNDSNNNDKDKLYAIQIISNGGSNLDTESIEGKVFAGEKNIERNNGEDFDIKDVFNDCQVVTFSN